MRQKVIDQVVGQDFDAPRRTSSSGATLSPKSPAEIMPRGDMAPEPLFRFAAQGAALLNQAGSVAVSPQEIPDFQKVIGIIIDERNKQQLTLCTVHR